MEFDLAQLIRLNDAVYRYRSKTGQEGDRGPQIVFIHGLQPEESRSPYFEPWLTEDGRELWPKSWLSESFPTAAMYLVHYDSCTRKDGEKGMMDMFLTAEYLLHNLLLAEVGQSPRNPVILVGHDIGGLVIKEICLQAFSGASSGLKTPMVCKKRQFLRQVKGIFYFSTPHGGFHHWDPEGQGELMANLTVQNASIARSNEEFRKMRMEYNWTAYGLGASHSLPELPPIEEASGRYDVDEFCMIGASSMNICRFKDRTSTSFQKLENYIRDTVCGFKNPDRVELPFKADPHYVPLERTVREIRQTLERPDIQVVVLWGDAGTGKSSLVKYLALQYEERGSNAAFWDGILYFECGHGTDALSIIRQMLRELNENEETISASGVDQKRLEFLLRKRLQNLNALMIVDDVWDHHRRSLVEKVVFHGAKGVKYLITSQQSNVWKGYAGCQIEDVNPKVAREIIVKNIDDLRDQYIPEEDEGIVNEIISATDFHPLALATIASSVKVDKRGRVPGAEWQELRRNLLSYLADEEKGARAVAFGTSYPSSVYVAMMNAVHVLHGENEECLHLLCILALFRSPLPTSVLHMFMLCTSEPQVSSQVSRLLKRLQGRRLVQDALARIGFLGELVFLTDPDQSIIQFPRLKLHNLRQQFILRCAEFHSNSQPSVEFIKEILGPFLSQTSTSDGGAHGLEPSEGHDNPSALSTALCALYGVEEVQKATYNKLICNYQLKLLTSPLAPSRSRLTLEILLWKIEEQCTSPRIQSALQEVVSKYIFQFQIDDDNVWVLISEGYYCALPFLNDHLRSSGKRPCKMITRSSMSRFLFEAMKLLRTEVQPSLQTLGLLHNLASCIDESYPSSTIDAFDLEVLINVLLDHRVQSHELSLGFPWTLLQILSFVTRIESAKFRWISLLRTRPSLQKVIESVMERSAANLNSEENVHWKVVETEYRELALEEFLPNATIQVVLGTLSAVNLLSELETFGEEKVAAIVKSISKPIQAVARSFQQTPESFTSVSLGAFQSIILHPVQGIRSVVWSIPGVIEGIVSVVCRVKIRRRSRPEITSVALCILLEWIRLDDGARSRLLSHRGFLDVLLEVIRDHREEVHPERSDGRDWLRWELPHFYAVRILEAFLTSDIDGTTAAAASDWASLPELHPSLSDLLVRYTDEDVRLRRSVLTILLYLGYNLFGRNDTTSCSHLRAVTPQHFQRTDVMIRSRAVNVQHGLENLLDVILKGQSKVARVTAVDLLLHLLNHSSVRARVYAMPEAATGLALLLDDDGGDVQEPALEAILLLSDSSETDLAMGFIRQIVLVSGVFERIVEFTRDDWDRKHKLAICFVDRYLDVESGNSSHIFAVQGMIGDMVMSMKNKHQNADKISCTLQFLHYFSRDGKNLSFFLSISGSVEAVVELVPHYTHELVELQLGGSEEERKERVRLIEMCFLLLWKITNESEAANVRIVRSGRLLDLTLDLLDKRQRENVQVGTLKFLADLAERSSDAVFEMMKRPDFIEKLSFLLHSVDGEKWRWLVMEFAFRLARLRQNVLPEKIVELVWSALQDFLLTDMDGAHVPSGLESLLSLVRNYEPSGHLLVRAPGALERLISLSLHHSQGSARADALHIVRLSLYYVFHDALFSLCLFKVLDSLPEILSQLERPDSVVVQDSVVLLLKLLVQMGETCENAIIGSRLRTELGSLYNSQVLENLTGLLLRDEPECRHEDVMFVLYDTARSTREGMFRIVGIPGTLERIIELVYRGNPPASIFLLNLILDREFRASAPRYLLKCLAHVASTSKGRYIAGNPPIYVAGEALHRLELCAWQNKYALRYLVDMLHKNIRYKLRAEAMNYLVRCVSDNNQEPLGGRTVFVSLQSSDCDLVEDDNSEPVYDPYPPMATRCILDSLVSRGRHHRLRLAKCVTGIYAHDLQMKTIDAPTVKRGRSTASNEDLHHGFVRPPVRRLAKHTRPGLLSILDFED